MKYFTVLGLVFGLLLGLSAQAAQLGQKIQLSKSAFCQRTDCQLRSIERLTGNLSGNVYLTLASRESGGYPNPGPNAELITQGGVVVSARLKVTTQDSAFVGSEVQKKGSDTYVAAQFLEAMTGHKPSAATLSAWEKTCQGNTPGPVIPFASYKLACEVYPVSDARQMSFSVMK